MKIKEFIAAQRVCLCEHNHLTAFLQRVESSSDFIPRSASNPKDDEPEDIYDDYLAAIYPPRVSLEINEAAGYAIIPVVGMISKGLSVFEQRLFGLCDVDYVASMVEQVTIDPKIRTVIFYFSSPGGYITGVEELAEKIAQLTAMSGKKTRGYADDISCSASYELMAQCGSIGAAPSAIIGSIGTYCTYVDYSEMAEKAGIRVRVFSSGAYKGMGIPGTSLTKEQADWIQARILEEAEKFKTLVRSMRPQIQEETMQGQFLSGKKALEAGLVDGLSIDFKTYLSEVL